MTSLNLLFFSNLLYVICIYIVLLFSRIIYDLLCRRNRSSMLIIKGVKSAPLKTKKVLNQQRKVLYFDMCDLVYLEMQKPLRFQLPSPDKLVEEIKVKARFFNFF